MYVEMLWGVNGVNWVLHCGTFYYNAVAHGYTANSKKNGKAKDNPFRMPTDEEVFVMRDDERKKKIEVLTQLFNITNQQQDRDKLHTLHVHEKTTSSFRHSSTRLHVLDDMAAQAMAQAQNLDSIGDSRCVIDSVVSFIPVKRVFLFCCLSGTVPISKPRTRSAPHNRVETHKEKENLKQFVEKKREMFLLQVCYVNALFYSQLLVFIIYSVLT